MKSESLRLVVFAVSTALVAATATAADPNTWWVDDACYGAAVQDGSEAHPFGTIFAAITNSACGKGDTIKVRPGTYDKDYHEGEYTPEGSSITYHPRYRVYINKKVNIVATGTKEETHIVGRFATEEEFRRVRAMAILPRHAILARDFQLAFDSEKTGTFAPDFVEKGLKLLEFRIKELLPVITPVNWGPTFRQYPFEVKYWRQAPIKKELRKRYPEMGYAG